MLKHPIVKIYQDELNCWNLSSSHHTRDVSQRNENQTFYFIRYLIRPMTKTSEYDTLELFSISKWFIYVIFFNDEANSWSEWVFNGRTIKPQAIMLIVFRLIYVKQTTNELCIDVVYWHKLSDITRISILYSS